MKQALSALTVLGLCAALFIESRSHNRTRQTRDQLFHDYRELVTLYTNEVNRLTLDLNTTAAYLDTTISEFKRCQDRLATTQTNLQWRTEELTQCLSRFKEPDI